MTREEAKEKIIKVFPLGQPSLLPLGLQKTIDKIYDYFENRSCENCKRDTMCHEQKAIELHRGFKVVDFCCNRWENKA